MELYYNPECFGLEQIVEIEWLDDSYAFDLTVVWQDEKGKFWIASDNGCSCPFPFQDSEFPKGFIGPLTVPAACKELQQEQARRNESWYSDAEKEDFVVHVTHAIELIRKAGKK